MEFNVSEITDERLTAFWEDALVAARKDPFGDVPEFVAEILCELVRREDMYLDSAKKEETLIV